jgi:glycerol-3-phosphate dehydrogenase
MDEADLIIVGGGISGLGIAREAGRAGLETRLFEAKRCASQTSNNTLRIIHGGFRYLQSFDIPRMMESIRDQTALLAELPEAVKPLPCLMPLRRFGLKSRVPVAAAGAMYHAALRIGGSRLSPPFVLSGETAARKCPVLADHVPHGALLWHDAHMVDPSAVMDAVMREAAKLGASIHEESPVLEIRRANNLFEVMTKDGACYRARCVVNALGPWIETIKRPVAKPPFSPLWCKGFNIEIDRQLDPTYAIGVAGKDGRLFFAVPRNGGTAIGTWYVPVQGPSFDVTATDHELDTFVRAFNEAFPEVAVKRADIRSVDAGVLPMIRDSERGPVLYGREAFVDVDGYIELLSTKYTTFRSQGRAVIGAVVKDERFPR